MSGQRPTKVPDWLKDLYDWVKILGLIVALLLGGFAYFLGKAESELLTWLTIAAIVVLYISLVLIRIGGTVIASAGEALAASESKTKEERESAARKLHTTGWLM